MARSWLDARDDLGIRVIHPFRFRALSGEEVETVGVYLPDFGSPDGMLLLCRFDSDRVHELADETPFCSSGLSLNFYEPYNRERFMKALSDWGWYGPAEEKPTW
jgi:hypothetical protein